MVNRAALGVQGEPFEVRIEFGKIREFARATMSDDPAYFAEELPVVPPTFLITAGFQWAGPASSVTDTIESDPHRALHASQEFVFHGPPPRAGDRLTARERVSQMYDKDGKRGGSMTFFVITTEFTDADGNLVAESHLTGVETAAPVASDGGAA
jgi:hypothetical protein